MRKNTLFILILSLFIVQANAQWEEINPGAGGQTQDVVFDPNQDGRLILASDVDGIFESTNDGITWTGIGDLHQNRVYAVAIPESNNTGIRNRMYVGNTFGLEYSTDRGNTFELIKESQGNSIGAITVSPTNPNIVLAGIGWRDDYFDRFITAYGGSRSGPVTLYRTANGGNSWTTIEVGGDPNTNDRNVLSISFDKTNGNNVYVGSSEGIFKSTNAGNNWELIAPPANTTRNRGAVLSPDGNVLYAVYMTDDAINSQKDKGTDILARVYATRTSNINWQDITGTLVVDSYWQPDVDPRSTGNSHKLILPVDTNRLGLFEATVSWNANYNSASPASFSWNQAWTDQDILDGWDVGKPNARWAHYTPNSGGWDRALWSTQNQTMYRGAPNGSTYTWSNRYSFTNNTDQVSYFGLAQVPSYGSRGTSSTYTWDIDAYGDYIITGHADNGAVESWDGGQTWSNIWMRTNGFLSDVQAVEIAEFTNDQGVTTPMVLAQMTRGFGGQAEVGNLYLKRLDTRTTADQWQFYAGGDTFKGALPNGLFSDIAASPADKSVVFVFSRTRGLYRQDLDVSYPDFEAGGDGFWQKITNGAADEIESVKKIAPHPTNKDIVYLAATSGPIEDRGVWKGERTGNGADETNNWTWTHVLEGNGFDAEVHAWENNGQVYLFWAGERTQDGDSAGDGTNYVGAVSLDEGDSWKTVLKSADTRALISRDWYDDVTTGPNNPYIYKFDTKGGLVGYDDKVIMSHYDHRLQKAYALLQGTITGTTTANAQVVWTDFQEDLRYPGLTTAKVVSDGSATRYLYVSTAGNGSWRRSLGPSGNEPVDVIPTAVQIIGCQSSTELGIGSTRDLDANVVPASATNKAVTWSSSDTAIATVDNDGVVTPIAVGSVTISVTTVSGNKVGNCTITVGTDIFPTGVQILGCMSSTALAVGDTRELNAEVIPSNATNTNVSWSSSNTAVATVSSDGLVTAIAEGSATITLTTEEGNKQATCAITVEGDGGNPGGPVMYGDCNATSSNGIPNPPCAFFVELISNNRVRFNWTDNSNNETQFSFGKFLEGDQWRGAGNTVANSITIERGGLTADARYKFRIRATNTTGSSVWVETDFIDLSGNVGEGEMNSNQFFIRNKRLGGYLRPITAEDNAAIEVQANDNSDWFKWEMIPTDSGFYYLRNVQTGKYIRPIGTNDGNRLEQKPTSFDGSRTQWTDVPVNNDAPFVYLLNRATDKYIRPKSTTDVRVEIRPTSYTGDWTRWAFEPVSTSLKTTLDIVAGDIIKMELFPNPVGGNTDLNIIVPSDERFRLSIYTILGARVMNKDFGVQRSGAVTVPLEGKLSKGMYLVKYRSATRTFNSKLIVR